MIRIQLTFEGGHRQMIAQRDTGDSVAYVETAMRTCPAALASIAVFSDASTMVEAARVKAYLSDVNLDLRINKSLDRHGQHNPFEIYILAGYPRRKEIL